MAEKIKVDAAAMAATIAKYTAEKAKLMEALQTCTKASQLIARSWAGPSFGIMCIKLADTYKNLFQSEKKMDDAIEELKKSIDIFDNAEKTIVSSINALDVGTSPFS